MTSSAGPAGREEFVRDWAGGLLATGPLTGTERDTVVEAIHRCYEESGMPRPGRVEWVPSPRAGQLRAAALARRHTPVKERFRALNRAYGGLDVVVYGGSATIYCAVVGALLLVARPGLGLVVCWLVASLLSLVLFVRQIVEEDPDGAIEFILGLVLSVPYLLGAAMVGLMFAALTGTEVSYGHPPSLAATIITVVTLVAAVVVVCMVGSRLERGLPTRPRYFDLAYWRISDRYPNEVHRMYADAGVIDPTELAEPAEHKDVLNQVQALVGGVAEAVEELVRQATDRRSVQRYGVEHFDGRQGAGPAWLATTGMPMPAFVSAYAAASRAGWWWPHRTFVVISERPTALHVEDAGGYLRLHRTDGPAISWSDGFAGYALHGTMVTADLVADGGDAAATDAGNAAATDAGDDQRPPGA